MKTFDNKTKLVNYLSENYDIEEIRTDPIAVVKKVLNQHGFFEQGLNYALGDMVLEEPIVSKTKKYIENFNDYSSRGHGLYLFGQLGVGKTTLATVIAHEVFKKNVLQSSLLNIEFVTANEFLQVCRDKMKNREDRKIYSELVQCDLLILDNLGNEYQWKSEESGNFVSCALDELIKQRTGNNRPTIITSNIKPQDIAEKYGEVIQDLICSNCYGIDMGGAAIRPIISIIDML